MIGSLGQPILFLVAPVSRFNIVIGRTLGGATISTLQGIIILFLTLLVGFRITNPLMLPLAFVIMFLISLLFTALGTAIASMLDDFHGFQMIMNFLIMPLFFLSGALFPLNDLPEIINIISRLNPLSYGVDCLRATLINSSHFGLTTDFFRFVRSFYFIFIHRQLPIFQNSSLASSNRPGCTA